VDVQHTDLRAYPRSERRHDCGPRAPLHTPAINEGCTRSLRISHTTRRAPLQPVPKTQVPCTPYRPPNIAGVSDSPNKLTVPPRTVPDGAAAVFYCWFLESIVLQGGNVHTCRWAASVQPPIGALEMRETSSWASQSRVKLQKATAGERVQSAAADAAAAAPGTSMMTSTVPRTRPLMPTSDRHVPYACTKAVLTGRHGSS
jgi:hypothetical protein